MSCYLTSYYIVCRSYPWLHDQVDDAHFVLSSFVGALNLFKFVLPMDRIVAIVWDFYLHCVAVDNQSLYILEVYHSEFAQLLWQHFIPQIIDLESMISVSVAPSRVRVGEVR